MMEMTKEGFLKWLSVSSHAGTRRHLLLGYLRTEFSQPDVGTHTWWTPTTGEALELPEWAQTFLDAPLTAAQAFELLANDHQTSRHRPPIHKGRPMAVYNWLVTGTDEQLQRFFQVASICMNAVERRGQTVHATLFEEDRSEMRALAEGAGVTVEQRADTEPYWPVLVQGSVAPWSP